VIGGRGTRRDPIREKNYQLACGIGADRRSMGATLTIMVATLFVVGCSNQRAAQTPALPRASAAEVAASRAYLNGSGRGLIEVDELAAKVTDAHTPGACRTDEKSLVGLTQGDSGPGVADPGLAELFGDEFSALSSVLDQCTHGDARTSTLSALSRLHTLVDQRLRVDKAYP
jgi:hypothetical protein